jgi:selenium-binding protein 1
MTTDPTFYRSATEAIAAPPELLAYVVAFDRAGEQSDALTTIDVDTESPTYGQVVGWADLPTKGDELHHFGWNACSSALMHEGHDMNGLARRYLLLPGIRSSRIHVFDTQPDPTAPHLVRTIDADELAGKAGYSRPHTLHCGPDGIFLTCLGSADSNGNGDSGDDGPAGIALLDHDTFDVIRAWETDDAWWHLNQNVLVTSEWGSPSMIENGVVPELLLANKYGHSLHFWDLAEGRHLQEVDLGEQHQMALELRPSHDPDATWGFVGVVISTEDLSASVWRWRRDDAG